MPKPLQYRQGSLIYFQGDPANQVYILQKGAVNLVYQDIENGQDVHDRVQPGEFFGVKSALGRYPREENAVALQDTIVLSFTVPEFETLAMSNTRIVMKMLKVFSNQLRRIHKQVSSLMDKEEQNPEAGLFSMGQHYLKNKRYHHAKYVLSRYLTYYPSGRNAAQAAKELDAAEMAIARGGGASAKPASAGAKASSGGADSGGMTDAAKAYYDAVSFFSQQKYQQAYTNFKKIIDANLDAEYTAKSTYEFGRCLYQLGKFADCIKHFTMMITKYPKHPDLPDALFYMGQSYEKTGMKDKAGVFYKQILTMPGDEDGATKIKAKRAIKALEG